CDVSAQEKIKREHKDMSEIMDILMANIALGIETSRDYKLGRKLLKFPRFVFHTLLKLKKFIKRD
ncbi:MAG: hypothetical protein IJP88_01540, partial [Synergistaceae bacterium]|nr:hypothetical protein [Synergistaceae bacterium]